MVFWLLNPSGVLEQMYTDLYECESYGADTDYDRIVLHVFDKHFLYCTRRYQSMSPCVGECFGCAHLVSTYILECAHWLKTKLRVLVKASSTECQL